MSFPRAECLSRVAKARRLMREQKVDALVVTDPTNFWYFAGQYVPLWMSSRPTIFVLPLEADPAVIDWSGPEMFSRLYHRPPPTWVEDRRIYPEIPFTDSGPVDWGLADVLKERGLTESVVAIELGFETRLNLAMEDFDLVKRQLPNVRWTNSGPITWPCRMVKSDWEIEQLHRACAFGGQAWERMFNELHIGISTQEIQKRITTSYLELGADLGSGPPTVLGATGPGATFQKGDILYLDGGCQVNGYRMDFTRRAVFGPPSQRQLDEHEGMWEILFKVIDHMKPGVSTASVFAYSQSLLAKTRWHNYSDCDAKRIGHGIGLGNEPPYLNAFDKNILEPGMSLTPEPKIETVEGLLNPEEHVIVRENGCEIISTVPDWKLRVVA